jgi:hypothetical protein
MRLHEIKRLLHIKENSFQNQGPTHRMGENLQAIHWTMSRIYKKLKKLITKRANNQINKWTS